MCFKTCLTVAVCAVCLLIFGGPVSAQSPSVTVDISPNPVARGSTATVTMTFSGLPLNSNLQYRAYVSQNFASCEGGGLGGPFSMSTGNN